MFRPAMRSDARSNASRGSVAERGAPPSRPARSAPPPRVDFGPCDAFDVLTLPGILERIAVRNIRMPPLVPGLQSGPAAGNQLIALPTYFELRTSHFELFYAPTISTTATSAHAIPTPCSALRRSPRMTRARITVLAGYSEDSVTTTLNEPYRVAMR